MTQHLSFPPEPWAVCETELDLSVLAQSEAIFAHQTAAAMQSALG